MVLLLVFMQLTRDLFAIAKFLYYLLWSPARLPLYFMDVYFFIFFILILLFLSRHLTLTSF